MAVTRELALEAQSMCVSGKEEYMRQAQPLVDKSVADQQSAGLRFDQGKPRYDLLPADGIDTLVKVYTFGAQKYADRNWEKGMEWSKCLGPLKRHLAAWEMGEEVDKESGLPHMAHVVWNAMALLVYGLRKVGTDNRVKLR